jgi:hypothetical protein
LREIAAASDFDFVALEPPRSRKSGARKRERGQKRAAASQGSRFGALWRYRTPAIGAVLLSALLGAIVVNAMFLQHGRHPAPLFGSTVKIEAPRPPVRPASIDALLTERIAPAPLQPVSAAQDAAFSAPAVDASPSSDAEAAAPAPTAPPAAPAAKKTRDPIGALIAGNGVVTPAMAVKDASPARHDKSVLHAQRALQKLGLSVKADGEYGPGVRKAVETFQRDNHLAVTGALDAKTRRLLAARSGLPAE